MDAREFGIGEAKFLETANARRMGPTGAERTDIEALRTQRDGQRRVVELGVVRQGHHGRETIRDGKPRLLDFGVSDEQAWEVGLACGGKIEIFVERVE